MKFPFIWNKETSTSSPPNRARGVGKVKLVEMAAGVAVSSGLIQVSVLGNEVETRNTRILEISNP